MILDLSCKEHKKGVLMLDCNGADKDESYIRDSLSDYSNTILYDDLDETRQYRMVVAIHDNKSKTRASSISLYLE